MPIKLPSNLAPLQYEYKPMALEGFAQPMQQLQQRFDTAKLAVEEADMSIEALSTDTPRSKELQEQLRDKQQQLMEELYKTKDTGYAAREIKKLNKVLNKNPEISNIRTNYQNRSEIDKQYRELGEKDPVRYTDPWRQLETYSRLFKFNEGGGTNYNWETGDYGSYDNSAPVPYLENEIQELSLKLADTAAEQRVAEVPEAYITAAGAIGEISSATTFKDRDQLAAEIGAALRNTTRYRNFLDKEGDVLFDNAYGPRNGAERGEFTNEIIDNHEKQIVDFIADKAKEGMDDTHPNIIQANEYLADYRAQKQDAINNNNLDGFARATFVKEHRDGRFSDFAFDASDIEDFRKINKSTKGTGTGSGSGSGITPEEIGEYQVSAITSEFTPGTGVFADVTTSGQYLREYDVFGTRDEKGNITGNTKYPTIGQWINDQTAQITTDWEKSKELLNQNADLGSKAEAITRVGAIAENTSTRARGWEDYVSNTKNYIAELKDMMDDGTATNQERERHKKLNSDVLLAQNMRDSEFRGLDFEFREAARTDKKLAKILQDNGGNINASFYEAVAKTYADDFAVLKQLAEDDALATLKNTTEGTSYDPNFPASTQSDPRTGIPEQEMIDFSTTGNLGATGYKVETREEALAREEATKEKLNLVAEIAPNIYKNWQNSIDIRESSRTLSIQNNKAVNNFTGNKFQELINLINNQPANAQIVTYDPRTASYTVDKSTKSGDLNWEAYKDQEPSLEVVVSKEGNEVGVLSYPKKILTETAENKAIWESVGAGGGTGMKLADYPSSERFAADKQAFRKNNPGKLFVAIPGTSTVQNIKQNVGNNYVDLGERSLNMAARLSQVPGAHRKYQAQMGAFGTILSSAAALDLVTDAELQKDYMELASTIHALQREGHDAIGDDRVTSAIEQEPSYWSPIRDANGAETGEQRGYKIAYSIDEENRVVANVFELIKNTETGELVKRENGFNEKMVDEIVLNSHTHVKLRQLDLLYGTGAPPINSSNFGEWVPMHTDLRGAFTMLPNNLGTIKR